LLSDRGLRIVRTSVLVIFVGAVVLYVADAFALWDEAQSLETFDEWGESVRYFGLTAHERSLLTGSMTDVPDWYPPFVVLRQVVLDVAALGIAWLLFTRRPRHWMAYLSTVFIIIGPAAGHLLSDSKRLEGTSLQLLADGFTLLSFGTLAAFLWLFPDGRFRKSFSLYVLGMAVVFTLLLVSGLALGQDDPAGLAAWTTTFLSFVVMGLGGIALQVWRYRHTPLENRRLARWNLVLLVAIPLWFLPFDALHDVVGSRDEATDTKIGFAWEQIHETLYLAAPVLLGIWVLYLVRRQGWWDFETLWNRTAVYGIGLALLAALYGTAFALASLAARPLGATGEQVVAVLGATAVVAFSYGPLLARVRRRVDDAWFPRRIEGQRVADAFGQDIRRLPTPDSVPERLIGVVQQSLEADDVGLWLPATGVKE
ncbi:MAG: hypothetical protein OEW83_20010, partial [Acidimicrobiia bacterium]|nr:hypothetical protein [Acidimicrobiia bacterium]